MSKKISIIVPCYNQAQYLDECLESILQQSYQYWECIIVDDGSPDNTEHIVKRWTALDERFRYYKKENGGVASARNFGITKAEGEWILPLDGDDKIGSQYLELASQEFQNQYTLIYCKAEVFGDDVGIWNLQDYSYDKMLTKNHIFCSAFFKKTIWEKAGGYDVNFVYGMEDWDFWLSVLDEKSQVKSLNYVGFYYRRKEESRDILLSASSEKQLISETQIFKKHLSKYLSKSINPIENFKIHEKNTLKLELLLKEIKKNFVTRFLYRIIEKL